MGAAALGQELANSHSVPLYRKINNLGKENACRLTDEVAPFSSSRSRT
jgi:hypothetical protein